MATELCAALENDIKWEQFRMKLLGTTSNVRLKLIYKNVKVKHP